MTIGNALADGGRRVLAAPALLLGVHVLSLAVGAPLAMTLRSMLAEHLDDSLAAERVLEGADYDWWQEFAQQAQGVGETFRPTIIGFAAVLENLSTLLDNRPLALPIASAALAYGTLWAFLAGGILDRYARQRPVRTHAFFGACGIFFFRFARLAVLAAFAYWILFGSIHPLLFGDLYPWLTRDLTSERLSFVIRTFLYVIFGLGLLGVNLLFDYAKIRAVVEDRRSMIGAVAAAWRFVARRPSAVAALYLANGVLFVAVLVAYLLLAPGATSPTWAAFVLVQAYIAARLIVKLLFYASQTAFFQGELAHAGYTAAPLPVWPESPAAEAIAHGAGQRS